MYINICIGYATLYILDLSFSVVASAQISNFFLSDLALMADFFEKYSNGKINNGYDK